MTLFSEANLAEYSALKQEQTSRITLREASIHINIVVTLSTIGVLALNNSLSELFPIVPCINFVLFWIYYINDHYVNSIRAYLRSLGSKFEGCEVFMWEIEYNSTKYSGTLRRIASLLVVSLSFFTPAVYFLATSFMKSPLFQTSNLIWFAILGALIFSIFALFSQSALIKKRDRRLE